MSHPAAQFKPVAWIEHHKAGDNLLWDEPGGKKTPLYAHPAAPAPDWQPVPPMARIKPTHEAADAFWKYWRENGETHKHGYYESTWGAINAALAFGWTAPVAAPCVGNDPSCPCQDGDLCHYKDSPDGKTKAWAAPAPDADKIMVLVDAFGSAVCAYTEERKGAASVSEARTALRAAVERVIAERDAMVDYADETKAQLPVGMKDCTILFKECEKGHGWLTATNWVQHECQVCRAERAEAERDALRADRCRAGRCGPQSAIRFDRRRRR